MTKFYQKIFTFCWIFYRLNKVALGVLQHPIKFQMKISRGIKAIELFLSKLTKYMQNHDKILSKNLYVLLDFLRSFQGYTPKTAISKSKVQKSELEFS